MDRLAFDRSGGLMDDGKLTRAGILIGGLAAASIALAGCAGQALGAPTPTVSTSESPSTPPAGLSGTGPTGFPGVEFALEAGSRPVSVEFTCVGGRYTVELSDSMMLGQAPLSGECAASPVTLTWPITDRTTETLSVIVDEGVDWTATPTFSDEEFAANAAVTADCERFGVIYSAFMNADQGYTLVGVLDSDDWTSRVEQASTELGALAALAQSELRQSFEQLVPLVATRTDQVGEILSPDMQAPISAISTACDANQTPLILLGEFGG